MISPTHLVSVVLFHVSVVYYKSEESGFYSMHEVCVHAYSTIMPTVLYTHLLRILFPSGEFYHALNDIGFPYQSVNCLCAQLKSSVMICVSNLKL